MKIDKDLFEDPDFLMKYSFVTTFDFCFFGTLIKYGIRDQKVKKILVVVIYILTEKILLFILKSFIL